MITISEASELTGRDRSAILKTIKKIGLSPTPGEDKREKLYNSERLLRSLYLDEDSGELSYAEVLRKLGLSKIALNEQELQTKSAKVMPCEDYRTAFGYYLAIFRTFCVGHIGKTLLQSDVDEAHKSLNDFLISQLPESEQPAARKAFHDSQLAGIAERIEALRDKIQRSEHRIERDRLSKIVRAAYDACKDNPNRDTLDALEAAQDACFEHDKKSKEHVYQVAHYPETVISDEKHRERQADFRAKLLGGGPNGG